MATVAHARTDHAGILASAVCAVHCGAGAVLASVSDVLENPAIELTLVAAAIAIASVALVGGYRQHGRRAPLLVGALGVAVLLATKLVESAELAGSLLGGLTLATAHVLNLRAGRDHGHAHALPSVRGRCREAHVPSGAGHRAR